MKKPIYFAIFLIFIFLQLSAQKMKDALYLKNGSIIYGKLIEAGQGAFKIRTSDGSTLIYPISDVEKFARETSLFDGRKESGFTSALELGLLAGAQDTKYSAPFSFNFLLGGKSNTRHTISFGSGVEFFGRPYTPLFIDYNYLLNDNKTSPFIFFRGGGIVPLDRNGDDVSDANYHGPKNYKGGASITAGTGISWAKEDHEVYLSFAYRYAHTSYEQNEFSRGDVTYVNTLNRLEMKFGFKF